ncbi:MAG: AMP-binding protein [Sphingomonadaceae bacterium]
MPYEHPVAADTVFTPRWLPDLLFDAAARTPHAIAIDFLGKQINYAELAKAVRRAATGFRELGAGPGVTVGLFLPNCPQYVIAYFGALAAGARVANFSPLYTADELRAQVADSEADIMVSLDVKALFPTIEAVFQTSRLKTLVIGNIAAVLPPPKAMLYRLFRRNERSPVPHNPGHVRFAKLLSGPEMDLSNASRDPHRVALLQYTGGTTGTPKGAMLTHASLGINAMQSLAIEDPAWVGDRVLAVLPLFHIFANTCIMNRTILNSGTIVMLPKFDVRQVLAAIARTRPTAFPAVPTMFRALLNHPNIEKHDFSSLRICVTGGAPMPLPMLEEVRTKLGIRVVEGYGLTESSGVVTVNPYMTPGKPGTVGQPLPGTEIRLLDKDDPHKLTAPGESGELAFRGPQAMLGYWKRDNSTTIIDGFIRTGDIATVDDDGYYTIVDRLKDMVIVGGFKVFPGMLEEVLYRHRAVAEAVVVGVPDAYLGERPKAFVALHAEWPATEAELLQWLNARVGKHEQAVAVEIRPSLPKTMVGKLSRKELAAEARAAAGAAGQP